MFIIWLIILVIYGLVTGFENIDPLFWWMLIPFALQDDWDTSIKKRFGK